jgi:hypothetical protein
MKLLPSNFFTEGNENKSHVNIRTTMPDGLENKRCITYSVSWNRLENILLCLG